jgi:hypothetical protein
MKSGGGDRRPRTPGRPLKTADLAAIHSRNNRRTSDFWDLYAPHRQHLLEIIAQYASGSRLCILGAGNANDLDLERFAALFAEVHLTDLDASALTRAFERQSPETQRRLVLHPKHEVSGFLERLPAWRKTDPTPETLANLVPVGASRIAKALPGPFDLVVSDCVVSQLFWTCFEALGNRPLLTHVIRAVLLTHLRALVALTRPGAWSLLVTDTISSDTVPLDNLYPRADPLALLRELDHSQMLFSGTSPSLADAVIRGDEQLTAGFDDVIVIPPWLWRVASHRTALVYALAFHRA